MEFKDLIYEEKDGIAIITFNRPKVLNALSPDLLLELAIVCEQINANYGVGAVVITGGEKAFAAGADINELGQLPSPREARDVQSRDFLAFSRLVALRQPTIASIAGFALGGGCEVALACDIRIAADNAKFGQPEITLGIMPGQGGTQRLPRLVGIGKAKELLFTGDIIDAQEAYRIGLVNKVVPVAELTEKTMKLAKKLVSLPPFALETIKRSINNGMNMDLASALTYQAACFEGLFGTDEQKEGVKAFIEKRRPNFPKRRSFFDKS
jgi:enoyl-CoA hydratase